MKKTVASLRVMHGIITDVFSACGRKEQARKSATTFNVISDIQGDLGILIMC